MKLHEPHRCAWTSEMMTFGTLRTSKNINDPSAEDQSEVCAHESVFGLMIPCDPDMTGSWSPSGWEPWEAPEKHLRGTIKVFPLTWFHQTKSRQHRHSGTRKWRSSEGLQTLRFVGEDHLRTVKYPATSLHTSAQLVMSLRLVEDTGSGVLQGCEGLPLWWRWLKGDLSRGTRTSAHFPQRSNIQWACFQSQTIRELDLW